MNGPGRARDRTIGWWPTRQQLQPCGRIHGRVRHDLCGSSGDGRLGRRRSQHVPQSLRLLRRLGFFLFGRELTGLHRTCRCPSLVCSDFTNKACSECPSPGHIVSTHVQHISVCPDIHCAVGSPKEHVANKVVVTSGTSTDLN